MNPFINKTEARLRAGYRIIIYIFCVFIVIGVGLSIPMGGWEYIFATVFSLGFSWVSFRFIDNRSTLEIAGLNLEKQWWIESGLGALIAALVMGIIFIIQLMFGTIEILGYSWGQPGTSSWGYPVLLFFVQMVSVGFYEELMMRSYLIPNFIEGFSFKKIDAKTSVVIAVFFSSSIFGIAHGLNPNVTFFSILNIVLAGVMLAIPYLITGRLAYSVGIHFAWNFFQGGVFGFRVSGRAINGSLIQLKQGGDQFLTGGSFGPEGGLIGTIGILLVMCLCFLLIKQTGIALEIHQNFKKSYLEFEVLTKENE